MNIINTFIDQWANIVESGNLDGEIGDIVSETPAQDADDEEFWKTRYDSDAMMSDDNRKDMARTMREISEKKYSPLYLVFVLSSLVGKDKIPEIDAEIACAFSCKQSSYFSCCPTFSHSFSITIILRPTAIV